MSNALGIVLAGGQGTRLHPLTQHRNKHLLTVHDKPMLHYALALLIRRGVSRVVVVVREQDLDLFVRIYRDGSQWNLSIEFVTQPMPLGIVDGYLRACQGKDLAAHWLVLGDNLFVGEAFETLSCKAELESKSTVFTCEHPFPNEFGVVIRSDETDSLEFVEKPRTLLSREVITGIYRLSSEAPRLATGVQVSERGEKEMVGLLNLLQQSEGVRIAKLPDHSTWCDVGTHENLALAASRIEALQAASGKPIGSPEWEAFCIGRLSFPEALELCEQVSGAYGRLLRSALQSGTHSSGL